MPCLLSRFISKTKFLKKIKHLKAHIYTSKKSHPAKESTGKNLSKFHIRRSHVEQNGRHVPSCVSRVYTRSVEKLTSVISFDVDFRPRPPLVLRTFLCPRRGLLALFCFAFWKTCIFMRSGRRFILSGC